MSKAIFTLLLLTFSWNVYTQSTYYVSTTGSDANSGMSTGQAWRHIQHAMDNAPQNSTIYILGGTYNEQLELNVQGNSEANRIVFSNYQNQTVILDGTGIGNESMLKIWNKSYVTIKGITVQNNEHNFCKGIYIAGGSDDISIIDCTITNINFSSNPNATVTYSTNANPFLVYGGEANNSSSNIYIDGLEIYGNRTGYSEALTLVGNVENFEVTNCTVHNNTNIGIDLIGGYQDSSNPNTDYARNGWVHHNICYNNALGIYADGAGIYVDGARDITIENNTVHGGAYGIEVGAEENGAVANNVMVRNNLIYNNASCGLVCGGYNYPSTGKVTNTIFSGNTLLKNNTDNNFTEIYISYAEGCSFENNIIYAGSNAVLYHQNNSPSLTTFNYNCWYTPSGNAAVGEFSYYEDQYIEGWTNFKNTTGQESNGLFSNPVLTNDNIASPDIHLQSSSPCIDAGNPSYSSSMTEKDYFDQNRIYNNRIDIGAHEYSSTLPVSYAKPLNGYLKDGKVYLSWQLANFTQHQSFEIERSANGRSWKTIMAIDESSHQYKAVDSKPLAPLSYYRLKQIDTDQQHTYSSIIKINVPNQKMSLYPNPTTDFLKIESKYPVKNILIQNTKGKTIFQQSGHDIQQINTSQFSPGVYFIWLKFNNQYSLRKIIIK